MVFTGFWRRWFSRSSDCTTAARSTEDLAPLAFHQAQNRSASRWLILVELRE
jgi:hypothetical protein